MNTGLTDAELGLIRGALERCGGLRKAVLFGSRAKGTARPNSDIDLAVGGLDGALEVAQLAMDLGELPLPYKFDVVALETISNAALREHIERVGITLYEASASLSK